MNVLHIARGSTEKFFYLGFLERPERQTEADNSRLTMCDSAPSSAGQIALLIGECVNYQFRSVITRSTSRSNIGLELRPSIPRLEPPTSLLEFTLHLAVSGPPE